MDKDKNKEIKDKIEEYYSDEETYNNNNNNERYQYNSQFIDKNLEDCYLDILENDRNNYSTMFKNLHLNNFENFIKKYN